MTPKQRLQLIDKLVNSDIAFEADCIKMNIRLGKKVNKQTQEFAELIMNIYKITHPCFSTCGHPTWERETFKQFAKLTKK